MELEQEVYMGFYLPKGNEYTKELLGISKHKDIIKTYLEHHRGLNTSQYKIEMDCVSETDLILKYSDFIISKFHGYYIPEIDQIVIGYHSEQIETGILNTIDGLKQIAILGMDIKKIPKSDIASIVNTLKILSGYIDNQKIISKMNAKKIHTDPFLFCEINEYLSIINSFKSNRELDKMYKYAMYE